MDRKKMLYMCTRQKIDLMCVQSNFQEENNKYIYHKLTTSITIWYYYILFHF